MQNPYISFHPLTTVRSFPASKIIPHGATKKDLKQTENEAPRPASRDVISSPLFSGAKSAEAEEKRIHPRAKHVPWSSAKADKLRVEIKQVENKLQSEIEESTSVLTEMIQGVDDRVDSLAEKVDQNQITIVGKLDSLMESMDRIEKVNVAITYQQSNHAERIEKLETTVFPKPSDGQTKVIEDALTIEEISEVRSFVKWRNARAKREKLPHVTFVDDPTKLDESTRVRYDQSPKTLYAQGKKSVLLALGLNT